MQRSILDRFETLFLALSDKTRLRLLGLMAGGETSVGFLADTLGDSQPKISRHLAYLRSAGLVSTRRDGKWIYYGIDPNMDGSVRHVLNETLSAMQVDGSRRRVPAEPEYLDDSYSRSDAQTESPLETYEEEWTPNEMEIFLL